LENRRRKSVTLADVMVIAAALDVPLAHLIWPPSGPLAVEALPGRLVPRADALEMLAGTAVDIAADAEEMAEALVRLDTARATVEKLMRRMDGG
jgi:hypothetical protein